MPQLHSSSVQLNRPKRRDVFVSAGRIEEAEGRVLAALIGLHRRRALGCIGAHDTLACAALNLEARNT